MACKQQQQQQQRRAGSSSSSWLYYTVLEPHGSSPQHVCCRAGPTTPCQLIQST
jgi:hypothetical protein